MVSRGPGIPHNPVPAAPTRGWLRAAPCTGAILARVRDQPARPGVSTPGVPFAHDLTGAARQYGPPNEGVAL